MENKYLPLVNKSLYLYLPIPIPTYTYTYLPTDQLLRFFPIYSPKVRVRHLLAETNNPIYFVKGTPMPSISKSKKFPEVCLRHLATMPFTVDDRLR